ncbi:MAG: alkyl hydroperoxide reductase, partial [Planctomycetia bacterium]|nr:alkyl hydroperoxide reductase [Planctomycetia bacterium]
DIDIPAGARDHAVTAAYRLPRDVTVVGIVPHMHMLGSSVTATAEPPGGPPRTLIDVPAWHYEWQEEYLYERPFTLPAGTRIAVAARFDNSAANPRNPSQPPRRVSWGDGTLDEMLYCFLLISADSTADLVHVILDNLGHDLRLPRPLPR